MRHRGDRMKHPPAGRVLYLGGWSNGPLDELLARRSDLEVSCPTLPTPPVGTRWLLTPVIPVLLGYCFVVRPWFANVAAEVGGIGTVVELLVSLCVVVLCIRLLVWHAIWDSVRIASDAIERFQPDAVVGFSWGGGVACCLAGTHAWTGPTILLAPPLRVMDWASLRRMPAVPPHVHVFHAESDIFCPASQHCELEAMGCLVHKCAGDGHGLCNPASVDTIERCVSNLVRARWSQTPEAQEAAAKRASEKDARFALLRVL
eukprot:TRINITY_DN16111_c0_g1_i1.p1 TRINITY_DN16111_c0_g1~~TRINITY_DN16111_c0_g1_i1.p1  ORF type:complete len:260 (+),score=41.82 TRINITY_DN16111_c0_g1_i1:221-1000(+)